jgi:hypothetical protein
VTAGLLAVSVALAWLVTQPRKNASQRGAEIIAKLASDTLEGYWDASQHTTWFIGRMQNISPIGWQMRSRNRESEGLFSGSLLDGRVGALPQTSRWQTKADLSRGLYVARSLDTKGRIVETRIALTDSEVTVVRSSGGQKVTATAARPDNYVPEGTFPLVLRLAATRDRETMVKMIFDGHAIAGETVVFVNVRLTPGEDNVVKVESSGPGSALTIVYHLDGDHDVDWYAYTAQGIIYRQCEKELVTKTFEISDEGASIKSAP